MSIWTREIEVRRFGLLDWFWKRWPVFLVLAVIVYLIYGFFQCGIMTARWIKRRRAARRAAKEAKKAAKIVPSLAPRRCIPYGRCKSKQSTGA